MENLKLSISQQRRYNSLAALTGGLVVYVLCLYPMGLTFVLYALLSVVLHLEVPNCPLILLPFIFPKEDVAIVDIASNANNA